MKSNTKLNLIKLLKWSGISVIILFVYTSLSGTLEPLNNIPWLGNILIGIILIPTILILLFSLNFTINKVGYSKYNEKLKTRKEIEKEKAKVKKTEAKEKEKEKEEVIDHGLNEGTE